jgi:uncharacterized repeat protein (TIGR02543 family)
MWIKRSSWSTVKNMWIRTTVGWSPVRSGYIKRSTSWSRFWFKANLPNEITKPRFNTTNNSGSGTIYDGPTAGTPQFINENLYGKDGTYSNYTSITGRKISRGDTLTADINSRTDIVTGDLFTSSGGVTTADRTALDGKYLFYEMSVKNGTDPLNTINSISNGIKMIKSYPALTDMGWTGVEQVGTQLTLNYTIENYYYNKIDPALSYVRWWRSSTANAGGTLLKEETITATSTGATSTSRTGTSLYTPVAADIDYYIVAEITGRSSYTDHYGYTDNYSIGSFPTGGVIGQAMNIIDVNFTDTNDRSGKNARGHLVTSTVTKLNWKVTGINSGTTYRVRYRVKSNETGLYYNPVSATQAAASLAWEVYEDNYNGTGNISSVSISGSTATLYDQFTIDSTFNGSTYGGGISRWILEYELSVVHNSLRRYWVYPNSMSSSQSHDYWNIDPTTNPSISASPATIAPGGTVTFSGTFNSYPAGLNSYPHSYKIVYGTSPATDSGWITLSSGTANQTYSNTKTYDTAGSYSAYIETTPSYTTNSASVTVSSVKVPPTMGTPTLSATGAFVSGQRRLSVPFTAVANSGPAYQIFWWYDSGTPTVSATPDGSGTTSSILDESGPTTIGRCYVFIRSSATTTTTGTTAPSTTLSNWSAGTYIDISGTRTLSYNKNTTDTVGSLPSNSSGTDPWNGWATTVSSNTPTRTGHTFNGYNTSSDGTSGTNYAANAAITLTSDVTLYAKWSADTYAVTYYGNGNTGGSVPDAQTKTYGVNLTLRTNVNSLTKTGSTFAGWNTNSSGTGTDYATGATYSGNAALDLYAKWTTNATAPSAPATPTVGTLSYSHNSADLATTLTRVSNTSKTQAWTYTAEVGFPVTWVKPTGATDFEVYASASNSAPADSTSGNATTSTGDTNTYTYWTTQSNRGTITRYFWVKAKNSIGSSGWSPVSTAKTSVATVVSGLAIRLYRGNGTSYSSPSSAPASTALSYAWTGITNRGNPNGTPAGEGHYATVDTLTIAGTSDYATSDTV